MGSTTKEETQAAVKKRAEELDYIMPGLHNIPQEAPKEKGVIQWISYVSFLVGSGKKEDLSLWKNWRGIILLSRVRKILNRAILG